MGGVANTVPSYDDLVSAYLASIQIDSGKDTDGGIVGTGNEVTTVSHVNIVSTAMCNQAGCFTDCNYSE